MANCNCCGCIVVDVLHKYAYGNSRYTFSAVQSLLTQGGTLIDCSAVAHPSTVTTSRAWSVDAYEIFGQITGTATGGSSSFDLGAFSVRIGATWSPVPGRETGNVYIYDEEHPPTQAEKNVAASVSLFGTTQATARGELIARDAPEGFADSWMIYFDPADPPTLNATNWPNSLEPTRGYYLGYNGLGSHYIRSAYFVDVQASIVESLDFGSPLDPYSGDFKPFLVRALTDLPEPAGDVATLAGTRSLPAHPGTLLNDFIERPLEELESVVIYAESVSLQPLATGNELAWAAHLPGVSGYSGNTPPNTEGFDPKRSLEFQGQTMLIVAGHIYSGFSTPAGLDVGIVCLASGTAEEIPANGFCTAFASRGPASIPSSYNGQNAAKSHATYYRDGVEVLTAVNPTQEAINAATKAEGSYLVVTVPAEDPWEGSGPDFRRWNPGFHKAYSSFIRDITKPAVGYTVPNDLFWELDFFGQPKYLPAGRVVSTEPLSGKRPGYNVTGKQYLCEPDERANGFFARPSSRIAFRDAASGAYISGPGDYTLSPYFSLAFLAEWNIGVLATSDEAGNAPLGIPAVPWKSHQIPADNHRGAVATLTDVGLQTCEYWRARRQSEKVSSVTLTFDRKIDPEGVDVGQFTLTKWLPDGTQEDVDGIEVEAVGDGSREWKVTVPTAAQEERMFLVLTYDPAGDVFTDDIVTIELSSIDRRPQPGQVKAIYVYPDPEDPEQTKRSYWGRALGVSTGPVGYHDLEEGDPPVDLAGFPYDPEPCVLAARTSWLMADESGWPRLIDTSSTTGPYAIGRVASLSGTVTLGKTAFENASKKLSTVSASATVTVPVTIGEYSPRLIRDGYVPGVPPLTSPPPGHSYFGLTTTIDPCPPASLSACVAPSAAQLHASAIRCDEDIDGFEVELVAYQGNAEADFTKTDYGNVGDFSVVPTNSEASPATTTAAILLAKDGGPISFAKTLQGETLPQNVWMAVESVRGAELPIREAVSRPPDAVRTSGDYEGEWYRVRYTFENKMYSQAEVLEWEPMLAAMPDVQRADGTIVNGPVGGFYDPEEIEFLPGDRYAGGSFHAPSTIGKLIPWWLYRRPPEVWPDDWSVIRHEDSGVVRQLSGGAITQTGLQACLSAWRDHRTYPALKTTTLGDLSLAISVRVTLRADVDYVDWQLEPQLFATVSGDANWAELYEYEDDALLQGQLGPNWIASRGTTNGGAFIGGASSDPGEYERQSPYKQGFALLGGLAAWQKLEDATEADSRSVTHQFCADISDVLVLNKFQEEQLAEGEDVMVRASGIPDGTRTWYWRIRKT